MPENDGDLPYCNEGDTDDGFDSPEAEDAAVSDDAQTMCQVDVRGGTYPTNVAAKHSNAWHYAGPETTTFAFHGGRSGIQVTNPDVEHRATAPEEHVLGRTLAEGTGGAYLEAGWGEMSYYPDRPVVFACVTSTAQRQTCVEHPNRFPLQIGRYYASGIPGPIS